MGVATQMGFFEQNKKYIVISIALVLVAGAFYGGYYFARSGYAIDFTGQTFIHKNQEAAPTDVNWDILWRALETINEKYVDKPVDQQALLYGAVSGLVGALDDPYSVFLTPQKAEEFQADLRGEFSGIGAEIGIRNDQLVVVAPLSGSPAEASGLRPRDSILSIDGEATAEMGLDEAVNKIRGERGTKVKLIIANESQEPHEVEITRDAIVVKSVESETRTVEDKKIGIIRLRRFGEETQGELQQAINNLLSENVVGVVLDLRNNPGGYITSAIDVSSNWVEDGQVVVAEQFADGTQTLHPASGTPRLKNIPTVVLVNEGSASASEIVAGALRDHDIAKIVGKKTFGKGSVQELVDLPDDTDLKLTIAKWLTPDGHSINDNGITPDIEVDFSDEALDQFQDPQLDRAIEELMKEI